MTDTAMELVARLILDSDEYDAGLNRAIDSAEKKGNGIGKSIADGIGGGLKVAGAMIAGASTAMAGFGMASVKTGQQFDSSMAQVAATMGKTVDEIGELRDFAQEMGASTSFSASQAADALNYMALAGYNADQSMEMLPNVLNLAAAGSMSLATASDMVTDAQTALGIKFEDMGAVIDQMAKTASTTNTSVSQLGDAFLTIGATARNMKGGTVELSQVLGVLADNGIKASEGGTHLRNMLLSLQTPSEAGSVALEKLGMSYEAMYDEAGNMRALPEIFLEMQAAMEGMDQATKDSIISKVFNKTDLAAANALIGTQAERWAQVEAAITDSAGAAQEMANTQLDNLAGDITLAKSAFEGLQIAISDKITPTFRKFVKFGADGLSRLTQAFKKDGLGGAMEEFGKILSEGISKLIDMSPQLISAGAKLLSALIKGFWDNRKKLWNAFKDILRGVTTTLGQEFPRVKNVFDNIQKVFDGVFGFIEEDGDIIISVLKGILTGFIAYEAVIGVFNGIETAIGAVRTVMAFLNGEMAATALLNPYTAIAAGIGVVIGLVTTLDEMERQEVEAYKLSLTTLSEENQRRLDYANEYIDKLGDMYDKNMDVVRSIEEQYQPEEELINELNLIVDANGRVKEGYEERAEVITGQLSEAFGVEISMQNGVIEKYDEVMAKIDEVIAKKKADALISANQDEYAQALKDQVQLYNDMIAVQDEYSNLQVRREFAVKAAEAAERNMNDAMENGSPRAHEYGQTLQEMTLIMEECDIKMSTLEDTLYSTEEAYYKNQDFITDYNSLIEASAGKTNDLDKAVENMTNGVVQRAPDRILKKQATESIKYLDSLIQSHKNGVQVSEQQIEEATKKAQEAIIALENAGVDGAAGYAKGFEDTSDIITNAENMVEEGLKAVAEKQDSNSPSKEFKKLGLDALDGYALGFEEGTPKLLNEFGKTVLEIGNTFEDLIDGSFDWGYDFITTFASGVSSAIPRLMSRVKDMAQNIKSYIHFSKPDVGPLSDFDTYAPDMMDLFAKGILDNEDKVTNAVEKAFDLKDTIISTPSAIPSVTGAYSGLITPNTGRDLTLIIQLNEEQLGRTTYRLYNDQAQRVGANLEGMVNE